MQKLIWLSLLGLATTCGTLTVRAFTSADADTSFEAHTGAFYREKDGRAWFQESTEGGKVSYWMRAEQMEMVLDAYERTRNPRQLAMFTNLFHGFLADHGTNWAPLLEPAPVPTAGVIYAPARQAFFIWNWDCGNKVLTNAIWRHDYRIESKPSR